jgi:beta-lactam-binding protein with PASTA domain
VRVPDVVGDRVRSATKTLERSGLEVSVIGFGDRANLRVVAQRPAGGQVPRGTRVVLFAGRER